MKNIFKQHYPFYISLIFFVFPIVYTLNGNYPHYILFLTFITIFSYISILHVKNKIIIFIFWWIIVLYIIYMSIFIQPMNLLFSFYLSNLLVWRFKDSYLTYRTISFFIAINYIMIYIALANFFIADKIIMFCFYFLCLITYFIQKRGYEKSLLKAEKNKYNEYINIMIAENERNRISRDLHDSIGHVFVMLKLKAELAEKFLEKNKINEARNEIQEIIDISTSSMKETRKIINNLKFRTIDEELSIIKNLTSLANINCEVINNIPSNKVIDQWIASSITMILTELTNNIMKHSKATDCSFVLYEINNHIVITTADNGIGFEKITGQELKSIRERLKTINGKIEILSIKQPTKIKITI